MNHVMNNPQFKLASSLLEAYEEHHSTGNFEVISVAIMGEEEDGLVNVEEEAIFSQQFSRLPWLAVPFSDIETRRKLTKEFTTPIFLDFESFSFIGANGKLLMRHAEDCLSEFGADFYPFTHQRVKEVCADEDSHWQLEISSIHSLLASPNRDFLISSQGDKVIIFLSSFLNLTKYHHALMVDEHKWFT